MKKGFNKAVLPSDLLEGICSNQGWSIPFKHDCFNLIQSADTPVMRNINEKWNVWVGRVGWNRQRVCYKAKCMKTGEWQVHEVPNSHTYVESDKGFVCYNNSVPPEPINEQGQVVNDLAEATIPFQKLSEVHAWIEGRTLMLTHEGYKYLKESTAAKLHVWVSPKESFLLAIMG